MALLHRATLRPSKLELLGSYLQRGGIEQLGSYRFDDPAGEVGIETHLVTDGAGGVLHLPLTYRSEPLDGADEWALGTTEHSVLGTRWVYNACADPVYAAALAQAILTGGTQVEQYFEEDGERLYREPSAEVVGSGTPGSDVPEIFGVHAETFDADTVIDAGSVQIVVRHGLSTPEPESSTATLVWHLERLIIARCARLSAVAAATTPCRWAHISPVRTGWEIRLPEGAKVDP